MVIINFIQITIVICLNKMKILMDRPVYIGFSVLDLSKLLMYETYYDKLQPHFGQKT